MAKTSQIVKSQKTPKYAVRHRNRCRLCGRPRAYLRYFELCRICFRKLANEGLLPGVRKSSW
ncbi:MAG: type Z 30S ribosomal protein S14 [Dehalococcoidia bacterium]